MVNYISEEDYLSLDGEDRGSSQRLRFYERSTASRFSLRAAFCRTDLFRFCCVIMHHFYFTFMPAFRNLLFAENVNSAILLETRGLCAYTP